MVVDQAEADAYARLARPALEAAGGTFVARGLPEQTYEAGETTRTVLTVVDSVARRDLRTSPRSSPCSALLRRTVDG